MIATVPERGSLAEHGIDVRGRIYWHPTTSQLYAHALARGDATLAEGGPLVVDTGVHTGRSPKDKFIVREPGSEERIWWGDVNAEISEESFERLRDKVEGGARKRRRLRRRCVRGRRSCSPHRRAGAHRQPVARALREDAVHRSRRPTSSSRWRSTRSSCMRRPSRRTPRRTGRGAAPSSFSIRRVPRW